MKGRIEKAEAEAVDKKPCRAHAAAISLHLVVCTDGVNFKADFRGSIGPDLIDFDLPHNSFSLSLLIHLQRPLNSKHNSSDYLRYETRAWQVGLLYDVFCRGVPCTDVVQ